MKSPRDAGREAARRSVLWASVALGTGLVGAKAVYLHRVGFELNQPEDFLRALIAVSYGDVAFAVCTWAGVRGLLAATRDGRTSSRLAALTVVMTVGLFLYGAMSVALFDVFGGFLTPSLLALVAGVPMFSSAVDRHLTPTLLLVVTGVAVTLAGCVEAIARVVPRGAVSRVGRTFAIVAIAAWILVGRGAYAEPWAGRQDRRIAENAHWTMIASGWRALSHGIISVPDTFPAGDLADFDPIGPGQPITPSPAPRRYPNVLLIVIESLGARWTSLPAGLYDTTANLERLSRSGATFTNFYAHVGRSSNSLAAMLMSTYPKLDFRDVTEEYPDLPGTSLATLLRDRNYRTAFMTSSNLAWAGWTRFLGEHGFDTLRDASSISCGAATWEWGTEDRCLVDATLSYMTQNSAQPFFVMAWTTQTHYPYQPSSDVPPLDVPLEPGPDQWELRLYLSALHETDRQLGRLVAGIRSAGLEEDTVMVLVGDHGQAFGYPHNTYNQGQSAYEEDVNTPFVVHFPRALPLGQRSAVIGSQVDIAPTIGSLVGIPLAPDWQGRNLFGPDRSRAYFYVAEYPFILGVREDRWKYLFDLREGTDELYDLDRDPSEQHNLAPAEPELGARLRQRLAAWMEANRRQYRPSGTAK